MSGYHLARRVARHIGIVPLTAGTGRHHFHGLAWRDSAVVLHSPRSRRLYRRSSFLVQSVAGLAGGVGWAHRCDPTSFRRSSRNGGPPQNTEQGSVLQRPAEELNIPILNPGHKCKRPVHGRLVPLRCKPSFAKLGCNAKTIPKSISRRFIDGDRKTTFESGVVCPWLTGSAASSGHGANGERSLKHSREARLDDRRGSSTRQFRPRTSPSRAPAIRPQIPDAAGSPL